MTGGLPRTSVELCEGIHKAGQQCIYLVLWEKLHPELKDCHMPGLVLVGASRRLPMG